MAAAKCSDSNSPEHKTSIPASLSVSLSLSVRVTKKDKQENLKFKNAGPPNAQSCGTINTGDGWVDNIYRVNVVSSNLIFQIGVIRQGM